MRSNRLQLNADKTEVLWCAPARQQQFIPSSPLSVCCDDIIPSKHVRDLGIYIDNDMSVKTHVSRSMSSCFAILCHIKSNRAYDAVIQPVLLSFGIVTGTVTTTLWKYCAIRHLKTAPGPFTVSAQCHSEADLQPSQVRPRYSTAQGTSLTASPRTNQVLTRRFGVQVPQQDSTSVSGRRFAVGRG